MNSSITSIQSRSLILGIGNSFRCDDGIGLRVIDELRACSIPMKTLYGANDPLALLAQWDGYDSVVIVDAVIAGSPPGTLHRIDLIAEDVPRGIRSSTHGAALADAVALAKAIDRLPSELMLLGIEPEETGSGESISAACTEAIEQLLEELWGDEKCTKVP